MLTFHYHLADDHRPAEREREREREHHVKMIALAVSQLLFTLKP